MKNSLTNIANEFNPQICILMATYNGSNYLSEQLLSIENQTYQNWRLIVSDDGSDDLTLVVLKEFQSKWGHDKLLILEGPRKGYCLNFLSMACNTDIRGDYYSFSDQDDVWMRDKLERACHHLRENSKPDIPYAYGSRTKLVDKNLNPLGLSPEFHLPRSFRNAIVQNIAGGNTIMFNQATKVLLEKAGLQEVVSHDWWLYMLVVGAGGIFHYDSKPTLLYRQHSDALIGSNASFINRISRLILLLRGRFRHWNNINFNALSRCSHLLTKDNQIILDTYSKLRTSTLKDRVRLLMVCGLYRQTRYGTLALWLATIINKL
jgi:glycosyltransferase involved in cell wall biosynthesis